MKGSDSLIIYVSKNHRLLKHSEISNDQDYLRRYPDGVP